MSETSETYVDCPICSGESDSTCLVCETRKVVPFGILVRQVKVINANSKLIGSAIRYCREPRCNYARPLWGIVGELFAIGSTQSSDLVRRYKIDPDECIPAYENTEEDA